MFNSQFRNNRFSIRPFYKGAYFNATRKEKVKNIKLFYQLIKHDIDVIDPFLQVNDDDTLDEVLLFLKETYIEGVSNAFDIHLSSNGVNYLSIIEDNRYFIYNFPLEPFFKVEKNKELYYPLLYLVKRLDDSLNSIVNTYYNEVAIEQLEEFNSEYEGRCDRMDKEDYDFNREALKNYNVFYKGILSDISNLKVKFNKRTYDRLIIKYPEWAYFITETLLFLKTKPESIFNFDKKNLEDNENLFSSSFTASCFGENFNEFVNQPIQMNYENSDMPQYRITAPLTVNALERLKEKEDKLLNTFKYYENVLSEL